jgi:hypothetical protein
MILIAADNDSTHMPPGDIMPFAAGGFDHSLQARTGQRHILRMVHDIEQQALAILAQERSHCEVLTFNVSVEHCRARFWLPAFARDSPILVRDRERIRRDLPTEVTLAEG